jgi:hypothetical protein
MGWQKVGEHNVAVNVNGTQRVNENITDDTTYDIDEILSTGIRVNGSNQGTWNQSSDSNYNVSVSASMPGSFNWKTEASGEHNTDDSYYHQDDTLNISSSEASQYWRFRFYSAYDGAYGSVKLEDSGGSIVFEKSYPGTYYREGFPGGSGTYTLHFDDDKGGYDGHGWNIRHANYIKVNYANGTHYLPPPNVSINGVTKS